MLGLAIPRCALTRANASSYDAPLSHMRNETATETLRETPCEQCTSAFPPAARAARMKSKQSYKTRVTSSPGESCSHRDLYVNTFSKWFGMTNALQLMMCVMPCSRSVARSRATASPATKTLGATRVQCFSKCANFSRRIVSSEACVSPESRRDSRSMAEGRPPPEPTSPAPPPPPMRRPKPGGLRADRDVPDGGEVGDEADDPPAAAAARAPSPSPSEGRPAGRVVGMGLSAIGASSSESSSDPDEEDASPRRVSSGPTVFSWTLTFPSASPREVNGAASPSPRATPLRFSPRPTIALRRTVRRTAATRFAVWRSPELEFVATERYFLRRRGSRAVVRRPVSGEFREAHKKRHTTAPPFVRAPTRRTSCLPASRTPPSATR